jgi:murein DD-endopeptidase MepM/ murein hydrolase activator NlpD
MKRVLMLLLTVALIGLLPAPARAGADPRWEFYTRDTTRYTSPWFARAHRIMIPFGCTRAPYYSPDPRCSNERGFHHGIDVAMRCGTRLFSAHRGWVVSNDSLGPAYGSNPLVLRNRRIGYDLVIAHTRRVFVQEGDRVRRGMLIAKASDDGAPDGCHLHFERRAVGGGLDSARRPRKLLALTPKE